MSFAAFNSNAYLHHIALKTRRPLELAKFYENALCLEKKRISGGWLLSGSNRRILILNDKKNRLGFAGFASQDIRSFKVLKTNFMEKGIKTFQDGESLFGEDNFFVSDCDSNKIYSGSTKIEKKKACEVNSSHQGSQARCRRRY